MKFEIGKKVRLVNPDYLKRNNLTNGVIGVIKAIGGQYDEYYGKPTATVDIEETKSVRVRTMVIFEDTFEYVKELSTRLPVDAAARKKVPVYSGVINYFPDALIAIAKVSYAGNEQHNAGQPLHWSRGKSADHEDTLVRHLLEKGTVDTDGHRHSAKMAWRALAILQLELEKERDEQSQGQS